MSEEEIVNTVPETETTALLPSTSEKKPKWGPGSSFYRYVVLCLLSLMAFGAYGEYDSTSALNDDIQEGMGIDDLEFSYLYTAYHVPSALTVVLGGIFMDKVGNRQAALVFSLIVCLGASLTALGPTLGHFWLMVAGRFVFGLGAESLYVAQDGGVNRWFQNGGNIASAYAILVTVSRMGTFVTFNVENWFAEVTGSYTWALWISAGLCFVSFLFTLIYMALDKKAERPLGLPRPGEEGSEEFKLSHVKKFPKAFFLVLIMCAFFYSSVLPLMAIAPKYLAEKYDYSDQTASRYASIVILSTICLAPFMGILVDKVGCRPLFVIFGTLLNLPTFILFAFTDVSPVIPLLCLGWAFSLVPSALWPSISILIKPEYVGTAFGLTYCIQNIMLACTNAGIGYIISNYGYQKAMIAFICLDGVAVLCAFILLITDLAGSKKLMSSSKKLARAAELIAASSEDKEEEITSEPSEAPAAVVEQTIQ